MNRNIFAKIFLTENLFFPKQNLTKFSLCLQFEKISVLWFKVATFELSTIWYFSLVHNLQISVIGLKSGIFFSKKRQVIFGLFFFHTYFEMVVWPSAFLSLIVFLCFGHNFNPAGPKAPPKRQFLQCYSVNTPRGGYRLAVYKGNAPIS